MSIIHLLRPSYCPLVETMSFPLLDFHWSESLPLSFRSVLESVLLNNVISSKQINPAGVKIISQHTTLQKTPETRKKNK